MISPNKDLNYNEKSKLTRRVPKRGKGQRGKGQRAKGKGQRAKGKGQKFGKLLKSVRKPQENRSI